MYSESMWVTLNSKDIWMQPYDPDSKEEYFQRKHVLVEGVFNKNEHGHLDIHHGGVDNVTRLMADDTDTLLDKALAKDSPWLWGSRNLDTAGSGVVTVPHAEPMEKPGT
jgi:hypothetical protein